MDDKFGTPIVNSIQDAKWVHKLNRWKKPIDIQALIRDPDLGLYIEHIIYRAGTVTKRHTHSCAHGIYVLGGRLRANGKEYPPGTMIWFPQGCMMEHGGTETEDADVLFIYAGTSVNREFDIEYHLDDEEMPENDA